MISKTFAVFVSVTLSIATNSALAEDAGVGAIEVTNKIISVSGRGHHKTFPCNGRRLEIMGSEHVISTTGECSYVDISGAENTVDVTIAPKGVLEVAGSNHTVRWKSSSEPKQDISGADHRVTRVK